MFLWRGHAFRIRINRMDKRNALNHADKSPTAVRRGKYAMRAIAAMSFDEAIAYTESQIALLAMSDDAKERLAAFNERRRPVWTGR